MQAEDPEEFERMLAEEAAAAQAGGVEAATNVATDIANAASGPASGF